MVAAARLKIGAVSKQTGIAVGALRYYESLGLLHSERGDNGYRYYPWQRCSRCSLLKRLSLWAFL